MRWFLLFLLAVNIGLLAWGLQKEPLEEGAVHQVAGAGMGNLRLLSEVNPLEKPLEVESVTTVVESAQSTRDEAQAVDQAEVSASSEPEKTSGDTSTPLPMPEMTQNEAGAVPESQSSVDVQAAQRSIDTPDQEVVASTNDTVSEKSANSHDQAIELTVEDEPEVPEVLDIISVASQPSAEIRDALVEKPLQQQCVTAGPIKSGIAARNLSEKVEEQGMNASLRQETFRQVVRFWVLVPSQDNQESAIAMVEKLQQAGIEDMRRFVRGKRKNAISLGAFSRRENAQVRQRELAAKGFRTDIESDEEESSVYWVDIRGELEQGQELSQIIGQIDKDVLTREQECIRVVTR
jgi:hypothetical protein